MACGVSFNGLGQVNLGISRRDSKWISITWIVSMFHHHAPSKSSNGKQEIGISVQVIELGMEGGRVWTWADRPSGGITVSYFAWHAVLFDLDCKTRYM